MMLGSCFTLLKYIIMQTLVVQFPDMGRWIEIHLKFSKYEMSYDTCIANNGWQAQAVQVVNDKEERGAGRDNQEQKEVICSWWINTYIDCLVPAIHEPVVT